jgi:hypothetical protein
MKITVHDERFGVDRGPRSQFQLRFESERDELRRA